MSLSSTSQHKSLIDYIEKYLSDLVKMKDQSSSINDKENDFLENDLDQ